MLAACKCPHVEVFPNGYRQFALRRIYTDLQPSVNGSENWNVFEDIIFRVETCRAYTF
jgi:hypothetical protein